MGLDAGKVVAYLTLDTSKFEGGIATGRSLMKTLSSDSVTTAKKAMAIGDAMASTGKIMTLGLTAPIVGLGTAAVTTFASFDDGMRQVQATMNASAEDTVKLTDAAKQMGIETKFSASQAAGALNYLALAGYDADKAIGALPTVLNLAQAGGLDLAYASDLATDAMAALNIEADKLTGFTDQMARTAQKSNTSVGQLGEAILTVGGTAKVMAGGTVELNAALGVLANRGIKGAEGGTMLRNVLLALQTPTNDAKKRFKELGLSIYDSSGNLRALDDIFGDLNKKLAGKTGEQRTNIISDIFNKRDLKAAEALLAGVGDEFDKLMNEIQNSDGAAAQMAETMEGGLGGSMRSLRSAIEGLAIEFGENLAPVVQGVVEWVTNLTRNWANLSEETQTTILRIAGFVAAAGPALIVLGKLVTAVAAISTAMTGPVGWITLGVAGVAALGVALAGLPQHMDAVDAALSKVDPEKLSAFKNGLNSVDVDVTVKANAKVEAGKIYDQVYAALTDGKPDTAKQTKELSAEIQSYYDDLVGQINLNTEEKLAGLKEQLENGFITLEEYQTRADAISTENGALVLSVQQTCADSLAYVTTMSGKSTTAVQGSLDELEALKRRAEETAAAVARLVQETESQEAQRAQRLVKAGVKTDEETTGLAFTTARNKYKIDAYDAEQRAAGRRKGVDERFDEKALHASGVELERLKQQHDAEIAQIEADLAADKARIQGALMQNLNELFAGLSGQDAALKAQLLTAFEKLDVAAILQDALDSGDPGWVSLDDGLMGSIKDALGLNFDPGEFLESFIATGDYTGYRERLMEYIARLIESSGADMVGLESSPMATAMQGLFEDSILAGLNLDQANMRDKLALALGRVDLPKMIVDAMKQPAATGGDGTEAGAVEAPVTVTPKPTVEEGAAQKVYDAISESVSAGPAKDESAPVVKAPITISPVPVAEEGSGQKLVDAVAGAITDALGSVKTAGNEISKAAAAAFRSEVGSAKLAGVAMVQGLIDGVKSKKQDVITTFEGIMVTAIQAAKRKAGIASPSKVFRGIGHNIADSFALGVDDRLFSSQRALERLVGAPANASKVTPRAAALTIDYSKLAAAMASQPVNLNLDGKVLAQVTAADNTRAVAERQRRLDIGKGLI